MTEPVLDPSIALSLLCQEHQQKVFLQAALQRAQDRIRELEGEKRDA